MFAHFWNRTQGIGDNICFKSLGALNYFIINGWLCPALLTNLYSPYKLYAFCELLKNHFRNRVEHISINVGNLGTR